MSWEFCDEVATSILILGVVLAFYALAALISDKFDKTA